MNFLRWLLIAVFGVFLTRTVDLMLVRGAYYRDLADNNRVRRITIPAARGRILTADGQELAQNNVVYYDLSGEEISRDIALEHEAKGRSIVREWVREYPFGEMTAHLTGYLGEANREEVNQERSMFGSKVGRAGLEEFYDKYLRGKNGQKIIEVGVDEATIRELGKSEPEPGEDLVVNIDLKWQEAVWQALKGKKGAVVVLNPEDGGILGLASYPSFDPNYFTINRDEDEITTALNNDQLPMLNRAVGGAYPPGSTFKMITAVAGLEEGEIDENKLVEDTGVLRVGEWTYANWYWTDYGRTDGMVNLVKAIQRSNDIYFYKVGEWVGVEDLMTWADTFGWGDKTGIDLPGETAGLLPNPDWKEKNKGEPWFLGNTYHVAIGQGDLTATPLQVAMETAVIANGGKLCKPHLSLGPSTSEVNSCQLLDISRENINLIKRGMVAACSAEGTAFPFFEMNEDLPRNGRVACKTGTAEIGANIEDTHAWFTMFYDSNSSEVLRSNSSDGVTEGNVVITVLLERGGSGSYDAAPVAKEIIERYEGTYEEKTASPTPLVPSE